jgi:head-tail adaptor
MAAAGNYPDRLRRLVRSVTKNTDNGQDEESFTPGDWYWCRVEVTNGRRQQDYGANQTGADVTITFRNYPTLSALDRMTDGTTVYELDNIRQGDNELIADGYYYDDLDIGG